MRRAFRTICLLVAVSTASAAAPPDDEDIFTPVEQGVGDIDPLATSMRMLPEDLRVQNGFDRVYQIAGRDGNPARYARRAGAITAVFPQSVYSPSRYGLIPTVPAGTVFYIGDPSEFAAIAPAPSLPSPLRVDGGVSTRVDASSPVRADVSPNPHAAPTADSAAGPPDEHVLTNEQYRQSRVRSLLLYAAHTGSR